MRVKHITTSVVALAFSAFALSVSAENANSNGANHNWMPKQPGNAYWQTPNWSGFNMPSAYNASQPSQNYNNNRQPATPAYRQPPQPGANSDGGFNQQQTPYSYNRPPSNPGAYGDNTPPPPRGPYNSSNNVPDNGASAFNTPGYNRHRNSGNRRGNMWGNNNNRNFWGNSGPRTWMNPNKYKMERGWDDMINAPSRMGEMPGGWTAPEVTVPNPIDIGDQIQDNVEDLPEQVQNMDVGN